MLIKKQYNIDFNGNLDKGNATIVFIIKVANETFLDFSQGTMKVL